MTVTVDDLARHLGFAATPADTETLGRALDTASGIVLPACSTAVDYPTAYQEQVLDLAVLTVAGDLWRRKDAPGGTYAFADGSDFPARLPRDPLNSVLPWLIEAGLAPAAVIA